MKPEEENQSVWNPEEAYRTSRAGGIRLLLLILAIAAAGALFIFRQAGQPADDLVLDASTTFEEADEILREAGWKPQGEIHRNGNETVRFYEGKGVFGCEPIYAVLQEENADGARELRLGYLFEESEKSGAEDPGEVYLRLRESLNRLYGSAAETKSGSPRYLQWKQSEEGTVILGYAAQSEPILLYTWTESGKSL